MSRFNPILCRKEPSFVFSCQVQRRHGDPEGACSSRNRIRLCQQGKKQSHDLEGLSADACPSLNRWNSRVNYNLHLLFKVNCDIRAGWDPESDGTRCSFGSRHLRQPLQAVVPHQVCRSPPGWPHDLWQRDGIAQGQGAPPQCKVSRVITVVQNLQAFILGIIPCCQPVVNYNCEEHRLNVIINLNDFGGEKWIPLENETYKTVF